MCSNSIRIRISDPISANTCALPLHSHPTHLSWSTQSLRMLGSRGWRKKKKRFYDIVDKLIKFRACDSPKCMEDVWGWREWDGKVSYCDEGRESDWFSFFPDRLSLSLPLAASLFLLIRPFCQRIDDPKFRSFNLSYFPAANSSRRNNFARLVNDASDSLFLTFDHCSTSPQSLDSPLTI